MKEAVIYTITNTTNNKMYVGYTGNPKGRKQEHWWELRNGIHKNDRLQKAWNKYGEESFKFEILDTYEEQYLPSMEHWWCNLLQTHNRKYGYNLRPTHPYDKHCIAEETRRKITEKLIGKKWSEQRRRNHVQWEMTKEHKIKLKQINSRPCEEQRKQKISEALKKVAIQYAKEGKRWGCGTLQVDEQGNYINKSAKKNHTKEEFSRIVSESRYKSDKIKRNPVIAYNVEDGSEYMRFRSVTEAATHLNKKSPAKLHKAIKLGKPIYNKNWKYESQDN